MSDVEVGVALAAGAAAVVELARERAGWQRREARARLLAEFSAAVNASVDDLDRALQLTAERVAAEIGDICGIWLLSDDGVWLDNVALHTTDPAQREAALLIASRRRHVDREPIATAVVREGVTLFLPEIIPGASPRMLAPEFHNHEDLIPVTSLISAALPARGEVIGTVTIVRSTPGAAAYTRADQVFLEELAARAGVALDNARLYRRAGQASEQLRQSQKMEAVGQLAGGIAHDFNNLLTVISGYGEMARQRIGVGPGTEELTEVLHAAERARQLTHQLLAFSRRQRLTPELLDLNAVTKALVPMLRRLIREDIELAMLAQPGLPAVLADRSQVEQVIINLAVNARDAMPAGGTLTVETRTVELDNAYARAHTGVEPGSYACLTVTDTGIGMSPEVMARVFEPFFTTKDVGRGTGLGLATVYGIATQSGGSVEVFSEPGLGTTVKVALPAQLTAADPAPLRGTPEPESARGTETVLLCEDNELVRELTERILISRGYTVLPAARPGEALALAAAHRGAIDILVSDVIMPEMPGPVLAERLWALLPMLSVIFMSGYPAENIGAQAKLPDRSAFLQKPFTANALSAAVRELLDHPAPASRRRAAPATG